MTLRPESSVAVALDAFGEPVFPNCGNGPVRHRTPEELGLPRVVPDAPAPRRVLDVRPDWSGMRKVRRNVTMRERKLKRDRPRTMETLRAPQTLRATETRPAPVVVRGGEEVVLPARAVMGAEMIGLGPGKEEEARVAKSKMDSAALAELREKLVADSKNMPAAEVAKKHGVPVWRVHDARWQVRMRAGKTARNSLNPSLALARPVNGDAPMDRGVAEAGFAALARLEAGRTPVEIRLCVTADELAAIAAKLNAEQRATALGAALKALLLG